MEGKEWLQKYYTKSLYEYMNYSKYNNNKIEIDGEKFDSELELRRYQELKLLERAGTIKDLRRQVRFELQASYKKNNKTIRGIYYVADFVYYSFSERKIIVEDTKGYKTEVYKLKKKLFEYKYKNLEIKEVF
jgi:hypothetical protein